MTRETILCFGLILLIPVLQCDGRSADNWRLTGQNDEYDDVIGIYDVLHAKRSQSPELFRIKRCNCFCRRKWETQFHCCRCMNGGCFPGSGHVTLDDGRVVGVGDLEIGQKLLTADKDGNVFIDTVIGYLDRRDDVIVPYRQIVTSSGDQLTLSGSHVIFVSGSNVTDDAEPRYAEDVMVGDHVLTVKNHQLSATVVTEIKNIHKKGAFVPLTRSGTLLVDNVLTSCYASFPHGISHAVMAPLRWFPQLAELTPEDGVHPYVDLLKKIGRALLPASVLSSAKTAP